MKIITNSFKFFQKGLILYAILNLKSKCPKADTLEKIYCCIMMTRTRDNDIKSEVYVGLMQREISPSLSLIKIIVQLQEIIATLKINSIKLVMISSPKNQLTSILNITISAIWLSYRKIQHWSSVIHQLELLTWTN